MRIHSDVIEYTQEVRNALSNEKQKGRIADHVMFKKLETHGSRSRQFAFEIQLEAQYRDRGRRAGNSGSYGAMQPEYDGYAATYDEWGWLLAELYRLDPNMVCGSAKHPNYVDADDFDHKTALSYNPDKLIATLNKEGKDPYPIVVGQSSKTKRGYLVGRRGADRVDTQTRYWTGRELPRTVAEVLDFASKGV